MSRLWVQVEGPVDVATARAADAEAASRPDGCGYGRVLGLPDAGDVPTAVGAVWVEARCRELARVRVASLREVEILAAEDPELARKRKRGSSAYSLALAGLIAGARETEASQEARLKADEERLARGAAAGRGTATTPEPAEAPQPEPPALAGRRAPADTRRARARQRFEEAAHAARS